MSTGSVRAASQTPPPGSDPGAESRLHEHLILVALLPDYVLGRLDETSLRRVRRHLVDCPTCREEAAQALQVLGLLAMVPPPSPDVRAAILQRAATTPVATAPRRAARDALPLDTAPRHAAPARVASERADAPEPAVPERGLTDLPLPVSLPSSPDGTWSLVSMDGWRHRLQGVAIPRRALVAVSAAVLLVSVLVGGNAVRSQASQEARLAALMADPATAYPLDDSELPGAARGVVFAEPSGQEVYLVANGLPVLPDGQRYQVWLFTIDHRQESAGLLTVEADGAVHAVLETPAPFATYVGVGLSAEPHSGSALPTSELVLGGSLPAESTGLPAESA